MVENRIISDDRINIMSTYRSGRDGIKSVAYNKPNRVLIDFQLEYMTGLEVTKRIKSHDVKLEISSLTGHTERSITRSINNQNIDALAVKSPRYFEVDFIAANIHVIDGGTYLDPTLLKNLCESKKYNGLNTLIHREFEIWIQSNTGKSDAEK